jgi:predicted transcriptional regulator
MTKAEKVTFNIPVELKEQVIHLKEELNISMSSIYIDAIKAYVQEQDKKRWQEAAKLMSKEYEQNDELKEWSEFEEDINEY